MICPNLHVPTHHFFGNVRGRAVETGLGRYSTRIVLKTITGLLLLTVLMVAEGWSARTGPTRGRTVERSERQRELGRIYSDPRYSSALKDALSPGGRREDKIESVARKLRESAKPNSEPQSELRISEPSSESRIRKMWRSARSWKSEWTLDRQGFADSFLTYYGPNDGGALSNALIIDIQEIGGRIYVEVRHRSSQAEKSFPYHTMDEMRALFPEAVKRWLGNNEATLVLSTGNLPREYTANELFKPLGLPFVRVISSS